jgi:hypothetical protein
VSLLSMNTPILFTAIISAFITLPIFILLLVHDSKITYLFQSVERNKNSVYRISEKINKLQ